MQIRFIADPFRYRTMTTTQIRETFLIDNLFAPGDSPGVHRRIAQWWAWPHP
jgi:hypothetical protein